MNILWISVEGEGDERGVVDVGNLCPLALERGNCMDGTCPVRGIKHDCRRSSQVKIFIE